MQSIAIGYSCIITEYLPISSLNFFALACIVIYKQLHPSWQTDSDWSERFCYITINYSNKFTIIVNHTHTICIRKTMFSRGQKFCFSAVLLWKISHRKLNFDFACHLKIKTAISAIKSLRKVRGKNFSRPHRKTKKPTFGYYEGESDQFNKRNCEIFIIKIRLGTNIHIIDYQTYRGTLLISNCLYFIEKALP